MTVSNNHWSRAHVNRDEPGTGPQPANARLPLARWRQIDPDLVLRLTAEYSEDETLRILNGPEPVEPPAPPVPFDPSLLAPPGAVGLPRSHRTRARSGLVEEGQFR